MYASPSSSQPQKLSHANIQHYQPQYYIQPLRLLTPPDLQLHNTNTASAPSPLLSPVDEAFISHRQEGNRWLPSATQGDRSTESFGSRKLMSNPSKRSQISPVRFSRTSPPRAPRRISEASSSSSSSMLTQQAPWLSPPGSMCSTATTTLCRSMTERDRKTHQRVPSDSTVGSNGPASPFDVSSSYPHIAHSEIDNCFAWDAPYLFGEDALSTKSQHPRLRNSLFPSQRDKYPNTANPISSSNLEFKIAMMHALKEQQRLRDEDSPAPSLSTVDRTSSSLGQREPVTPTTSYAEDYPEEMVTTAGSEFRYSMPSLDRTMSEVYADELYNPSTLDSVLPEGGLRQALVPNTSDSRLLSPYQNVFCERIQAANNGHVRARSSSPGHASARDLSSFGLGLGPPSPRFGSVAHIREQQKAAADAEALRRANPPHSDALSDTLTISPKDAVLDYIPTEEDDKMPLFPPADFSPHYSSPSLQTKQQQVAMDSMTEAVFNNVQPCMSGYGDSEPVPNFKFAPIPLRGGFHIPQQYPFIPQARRHQPTLSHVDSTPEFPAHLASMQSTVSESSVITPTNSLISRPSRTNAESGTYTCTYGGCSLRFESPQKLQKHKREGHRQAIPPLSSPKSPRIPSEENIVAEESTSTDAAAALLRNSQAGPHTCERINPSTGKPCNTVFSRPYDLTRHEDTLHNARKQKVRCQLCTEDKSFSRNDALTRHMRVVHPDVDFGGRSRRKHLI